MFPLLFLSPEDKLAHAWMLYFSTSLLLLESEFEKQIKSKLFESGIQIKGKYFPGMCEVPGSTISTAKTKSTLPKKNQKKTKKFDLF